MKTMMPHRLLWIILIGLMMGTLACGAKTSTPAISTTTALGGGTAPIPITTPAPIVATPPSVPPPIVPSPPSVPPPIVSPPAVPTPAASGLPTPPSNAKVFEHLEEASDWVYCGEIGCAGGNAGSPSIALRQTSPSMDGDSVKFGQSGVWANALWWKKVGANNDATNFLWDFYVQLDTASLTSAQSLEFDAFQSIGGYNYMIGSQCDYGAGVWDTWDEFKGQWQHTTIPCAKFEPRVWHHIQWYLQSVPKSHSYSYVTLVVDGKSYSVNRSYSAKYLAWGDNAGVQYQLDVNATGGSYQEWIDKSTLTVW